MWTTVLVLAVALNLEPTRLGVITLLLVRPRPIPQLVAFLLGSFLTSSGAGLLVLLALHHGVAAGNRVNGAKVQIVIGVLVLALAAFLASGLPVPGSARRPAGADRQPPLVEWLSARSGGVLQGSSPWFAAALGVGLAIPSVDYLALLMVIATSGLALPGQFTALLVFLTVANGVVLAPLISYLVAPDRTRTALDDIRAWVLSRRRRDYAAVVAVAGAVMIVMGLKGL